MESAGRQHEMKEGEWHVNAPWVIFDAAQRAKLVQIHPLLQVRGALKLLVVEAKPELSTSMHGRGVRTPLRLRQRS